MSDAGTRRWRWSTIGTVAVLCLAVAVVLSAQTRQGSKDATPSTGAAPLPAMPPAATIGDEVISIADLERRAVTELANLEQQRYRVLDQKLNEMIGERLLGQEAKRRGTTVEALLEAEVASKVPPVSAEEVTTFMTQNRSRLPKGDETELKARVTDYLARRASAQRREAFVAGLRAQNAVQVYLAPPEPVRVKMDGDVGYARGPREAPVTIVEFSDFQCPFCKSVVVTLKSLAAQYPEKVRWVFRDFPIPSLHPQAVLVHEAARCAGDQGKFWPYHDLLFEKATRMTPEALRGYAAEVGADAAAFDQCLESRKFRAAVAADMEAGTKAGVTGTPTFFINGRLLVGNQPLAEFQRVIERELARTAAAPKP